MILKALLFDVDGTLADTEETHRQAFNYAFVRFGLPWEWTKPLYRELLRISGGRERIAHYIETLRAPTTDKAKLRGLVPAIHATKTELYTELIGDGRCPLRPGVLRLFDEARDAGLQLAIASTTSAVNVDTLLARHLGDAGRYRFKAIACAEHVQRKKPAPDIYQLVMAMLGRCADECVAFEDSSNGLIAARSAGLFTVVTPTQWTLGDDLNDADILLTQLGAAGSELAAVEAERIGARWLDVATLSRLHAQSMQHVPAGGAAV